MMLGRMPIEFAPRNYDHKESLYATIPLKNKHNIVFILLFYR